MANENDKKPLHEREDVDIVPLSQPPVRNNESRPQRPLPAPNPDYDSDLFKSNNPSRKG